MKEEDSIDLREIFETIWGLKLWIILSVVLWLGLAFIYGKCKTPVYESTASILLLYDGTGSGSAGNDLLLIPELSGRSLRYKINNEVYILQTISLLQQVVENLDLNIQYYKKKRFKQQELYQNSPVMFQWENLVPIDPEGMKSLQITLKVKPDRDDFEITQMLIGGEKTYIKDKIVKYGEVISTPVGLFSITNLGYETNAGSRSTLTIKVGHPRAFANRIKRNLTVKQISDGRTAISDIITLTLQDESRERSVHILNSLIQTYIDDSKQFKAQSINKSIVFIDDRLDQIEHDLGIIETDYSSYRSVRKIVREDSQSQMALTSDARYRDEVTELEIQMKLLGMIREFLAGQHDTHEMIPANLGIKDVGLTSGIERYNTLVVERNRLLAGSSLTNPRVVNANLQLDNMKEGIHVSIKNVENTHQLRIESLQEQIFKGEKEIATIPSQQLELARITRRQEIIEPLYRLLQQKKEENMISLYALPDNARLMESPAPRFSPVKPNKRKVYLASLLLGLILPPGIFYTIEVLRRKIIGKNDVEKRTNIPIFAIIPKSTEPNFLIDITGKDSITEGFRMLRSNLQFSPGKVIYVTSSISGEGKTFIASNLAISLAATNKKTLLIGADLRMQKISDLFGVSKMTGLVNYLIGKHKDVKDIIKPSGINPNLEIMPSGPVPPNPSELLAAQKFQKIIEYTKEKYDFVVVDTAPCFLASDTFNIAQFADTTLYVIRSKMTDIRMIPEIQEFYDKGRLNNISLVINAFDATRSPYGYGSGYRYGYGASYGYGYGGL